MKGECERMKKKVLLSLVLVAILFVTGCGGKEESKTLTCTRKATVTTGVDMDLTYKVTYKGDYVQLVETEEKVIADNKTYLETYKTTVENLYAPYKDVEHYEYDVNVDGKTLTSKTKINYEKIDTKKLIEIDSANSALIKDGKIKLTDIRSVYEGMGASCK